MNSTYVSLALVSINLRRGGENHPKRIGQVSWGVHVRNQNLLYAAVKRCLEFTFGLSAAACKFFSTSFNRHNLLHALPAAHEHPRLRFLEPFFIWWALTRQKPWPKTPIRGGVLNYWYNRLPLSVTCWQEGWKGDGVAVQKPSGRPRAVSPRQKD